MPKLLFEEITIGLDLPDLVKGPISTAHIMRWSAAIENWHRIHYDLRYATEHDRLPNVLISGSWKQHIIIQLVSDWVRGSGWLWKLALQFRAMNVPGDTLTAWGRVTGKEERRQYGLAFLEVGLRNQNGVESTPGNATVVLPRHNGPPVPYPFDPAILD